MKSYIPKQQKHTRERLEVKLERPLLERFERYCQYLDSDRDYVVSCLLQVVFRKDKGFAEWCAVHGAIDGTALESRPMRTEAGSTRS